MDKLLEGLLGQHKASSVWGLVLATLTNFVGGEQNLVTDPKILLASLGVFLIFRFQGEQPGGNLFKAVLGAAQPLKRWPPSAYELMQLTQKELERRQSELRSELWLVNATLQQKQQAAAQAAQVNREGANDANQFPNQA